MQWFSRRGTSVASPECVRLAAGRAGPSFKVVLFLALALAGLVVGWLSTSGEKTQLVRVLDVVLFAPLLAVAGGLLLRDGFGGGGGRGSGEPLLVELPRGWSCCRGGHSENPEGGSRRWLPRPRGLLGAALVVVGFSTAAYNARNFWAESGPR